MLHAPGGGSIKRIAQLANQNKMWFDNTWGTLPWFTPFEAGDYYTMYAVPEEFSAQRAVTAEVCKAVMDTFGGGEIVGVTGVEGNSTDLIRVPRPRRRRSRTSQGSSSPASCPASGTARTARRRWRTSSRATPHRGRHRPERRRRRRLHRGAARRAGMRPGSDVFLSGADGTTRGAETIKKGTALGDQRQRAEPTWAALLATRLYDVMNGWRPRDAPSG